MKAGFSSVTLVTLLTCTPAALALSWPVCEGSGSVWVTERPATEPTTPGADVMWFCESGINILGNAIDAGSDIEATGDATCRMLGYDGLWAGDISTTTAAPGEPVQALNGDYCLRSGHYSNELPLPDALLAMPGQPCKKIDSITCIRHRTTMVQFLDSLHLSPAPEPSPGPTASPTAAAAAAASAPSPSPTRTELSMSEQSPQPAGDRNAHAVYAAEGPSNGGRKLLRL